MLLIHTVAVLGDFGMEGPVPRERGGEPPHHAECEPARHHRARQFCHQFFKPGKLVLLVLQQLEDPPELEELEKNEILPNPNRIRWRGASRAAAPTTMGNLKRGRGAGVGLGRSSSRADRRHGGRGVSLSLSRSRSLAGRTIHISALSLPHSLSHSACFRDQERAWDAVSGQVGGSEGRHSAS